MKAIEIAVRELHARTGHYVRKAARQPIIITDRGRRVAALRPLGPEVPGDGSAAWAGRLRDPAFAAVVEEPVGGTDSSVMVEEERAR